MASSNIHSPRPNNKTMQWHTRKNIRLQGYDYSSDGSYFITICVNNRRCLFGDAFDGEMVLNEYGLMADKWWRELTHKYNMIKIDEYKIMPNHLHGIITIIGTYGKNNVGAGFPRPDNGNDKGRGDRAPTLGQIMAYFKYGITKQINIICNTSGMRLWQRNFYEHIIRNDSELNRIRQYTIDNPANWGNDRYYTG